MATLQVAFGQYLITLEGDAGLLRLLPASWQDFRLCGVLPAHFRVFLCRGPLPGHLVAGRPWSVLEDGTCRCAVFWMAGFPVFSLRYAPGSCDCLLTIEDAVEGPLLLGLQYALMTLLAREAVSLHGVSLFCGDQRLILSAPSGTGKTTLATLLSCYRDATVINGDYAVLSFTRDGTVFFEPTPFCGSSGVCINVRFPVDGLVFLGQAPSAEWETLNVPRRYARLLGNVYVPTFDPALDQAARSNALRLVSSLPIAGFHFAPDREAAEAFARTPLSPIVCREA